MTTAKEEIEQFYKKKKNMIQNTILQKIEFFMTQI